MPEFSFGRNWEEFIRINFSEERVSIAQRHILDFLGLTDLKGRYIVDIGCGSGLHSLAFLKAGAGKIISFDVDPLSVETTRRLRKLCGDPAGWEVLEGSILDDDFLRRIAPADIIYSWESCTTRAICGKPLKIHAGWLKKTGYFTSPFTLPRQNPITGLKSKEGTTGRPLLKND